MAAPNSHPGVGCDVSLTPELGVGCGVTLHPELGVVCGVTLTLELGVGCGVTLTPKLGVGLGVTLTSELGVGCCVTLTPELGVGLGVTLTSELDNGREERISPSRGSVFGDASVNICGCLPRNVPIASTMSFLAFIQKRRHPSFFPRARRLLYSSQRTLEASDLSKISRHFSNSWCSRALYPPAVAGSSPAEALT